MTRLALAAMILAAAPVRAAQAPDEEQEDSCARPPITRPAEVKRLGDRVAAHRVNSLLPRLVSPVSEALSALVEAQQASLRQAVHQLGGLVHRLPKQARTFRDDPDVAKYLGPVTIDDQGTPVTYAHLADVFQAQGEPSFDDAEDLYRLLHKKGYKPPTREELYDDPDDPEDSYQPPPKELYDRLRYAQRDGRRIIRRLDAIASSLDSAHDEDTTAERRSRRDERGRRGLGLGMISRLRSYFGTHSLQDCIEPEGYLPPLAALAAMFARDTRIRADGHPPGTPPGRAQQVYDFVKAKRDSHDPQESAYHALDGILDDFERAMERDHKDLAAAVEMLAPPPEGSVPRQKARKAARLTEGLAAKFDAQEKKVAALAGDFQKMTFAADAQTDVNEARQGFQDALDSLRAGGVLADLAAEDGGPAASASGQCKLIETGTGAFRANMALMDVTALMRRIEASHKNFMRLWREGCKDGN